MLVCIQPLGPHRSLLNAQEKGLLAINLELQWGPVKAKGA